MAARASLRGHSRGRETLKESIKLQIRSSELRSKLNALSATEGDLTAEQTAEVSTLSAELESVEAKLRAALAAEPDGAEDATPSEDGESRELAKLHARASAAEVLRAAAKQTVPEGATAELQAHYKLGPHSIPTAMLASVTTPTTGQETSQQETEMPVFASPFAMAANVRRVMVPTGAALFPTVSAPTDGPDAVAESAAVSETTITIGGTQLSPSRIQIGAEYTYEDAAVFAGLEDDVRRVFSDAIADGLDRQAARGTSGIFDVGSDADDSGAITYAAALAHAYGRVDGRYATSLADVGLLVGAATYAKLGSVFAATTGGEVSAAEKLRELLRDFRVSAHAPAVASDIQQAVFVLGMRRNAVQAVWPAVEVIRDPYTAASTGEVKLNAIALAGFGITRAAGYKRIGIHTGS